MIALRENFEVPIKCQGCGHETKHGLARLQADRVVACPNCGTRTEIIGDGLDEFVTSLESVDQAFKKLGG